MSEPFSSIDELFCPAGGRVTFVGTDSQGKELLMAAFLAGAGDRVCTGVPWQSPRLALSSLLEITSGMIARE
jgi:hypothetical protein